MWLPRVSPTSCPESDGCGSNEEGTHRRRGVRQRPYSAAAGPRRCSWRSQGRGGARAQTHGAAAKACCVHRVRRARCAMGTRSQWGAGGLREKRISTNNKTMNGRWLAPPQTPPGLPPMPAPATPRPCAKGPPAGDRIGRGFGHRLRTASRACRSPHRHDAAATGRAIRRSRVAGNARGQLFHRRRRLGQECRNRGQTPYSAHHPSAGQNSAPLRRSYTRSGSSSMEKEAPGGGSGGWNGPASSPPPSPSPAVSGRATAAPSPPRRDTAATPTAAATATPKTGASQPTIPPPRPLSTLSPADVPVVVAFMPPPAPAGAAAAAAAAVVPSALPRRGGVDGGNDEPAAGDDGTAVAKAASTNGEGVGEASPTPKRPPPNVRAPTERRAPAAGHGEWGEASTRRGCHHGRRSDAHRGGPADRASVDPAAVTSAGAAAAPAAPAAAANDDAAVAASSSSGTTAAAAAATSRPRHADAMPTGLGGQRLRMRKCGGGARGGGGTAPPLDRWLRTATRPQRSPGQACDNTRAAAGK